jgi:DNA-binding beta-propeller fold protein YncE
MRHSAEVSLLLLLFILGCRDEEPVLTGSIEVQVYYPSERPVAGARVFSDPATQELITDNQGIARFLRIPTGTYTIHVVDELGGALSHTLDLDSDPPLLLQFRLPNDDRGANIYLYSPQANAPHTVSVDDSLHFNFFLSLPQGDGEVPYTIVSDRDGEVYRSVALTGERQLFQLAGLSLGLHRLQLNAILSGVPVTSVNIEVEVVALPNRPTLQRATAVAEGNHLVWSASDNHFFQAYGLELSYDGGQTFRLLHYFDFRTDTTFLHTGLEYGRPATYRIAEYLQDRKQLYSDTLTVAPAGQRIELPSSPQSMIADPRRPYLYALDSVNAVLYIVNLAQLTVEQTIPLDEHPHAMTLSPAGTELYIACLRDPYLTVVDVAAQRVSRKLPLFAPRGGKVTGASSVAVLADNRLAYTGPGGLAHYVVLAQSNCDTIASSATFELEPLVLARPGSDQLLVLYERRIEALTLSQGRLRQDYSVSVPDNSGARGFLAAQGRYLFYGRNKFDTDDPQRILGSFPYAATAVSEDGNYVAIGNRLYDGHSFTEIAAFPDYLHTAAFSSATGLLYATLTDYTDAIQILPLP